MERRKAKEKLENCKETHWKDGSCNFFVWPLYPSKIAFRHAICLSATTGRISTGGLFAFLMAYWRLLSMPSVCNFIYTHTPKSLQCLRLTAIPNQNARHDPCPGTDLAKPLSPLETLALTSLDQTIMVLLCSIRFWSNPIGTPVSNGPFFVGTVDAHKQKREAGPFPSLYTAGWVLIKEKNKVQNEVRKKPRIYTHGLWPASRKPALPWITGSETMTICRIPAHRHGSVEMIIPALCRSTRKQQQQQPSNQQPQQQQDASSCRTQQQPSQTQWERN